MTSYGQFYGSTPSVVPWHYTYRTGMWPFGHEVIVSGAYTNGVFSESSRGTGYYDTPLNAPYFPHSDDWIKINGHQYWNHVRGAGVWEPILQGDTLDLSQFKSGEGGAMTVLNG